MNIAFSPEELQEVDRIKSKYPEQKAAIMPVMWMAQKKWGWLSEDVMKYIGELLDLPYAHVLGVASFYTMYFKKPMGKHHVQVCTNVSCMLKGGEEIYRYVSHKYGIKHNQRTEDGIISLEEVECMGACGGAPMIVINEDFFENVDIAQVEKILSELK
ncbi:MAG TPA: NAD(P)H-dependent oxidoreductase subunit E [Patescibacteria group bacterium]|nr:NAD(P)H-dependent oxidoreductase subunit E [Patescibacteria group bacterium]